MSASGYHRSVRKVWLVEAKDRRFSDGWFPISVHLNKAAAEYAVEIFKYQCNDPSYARVTELKVVKNERNR